MPELSDVRAFWDRQPLFTDESDHPPGSAAFFEQHRRVYREDCFAGSLDGRLFPPALGDKKVLDVGCGIGFWLVEFWERGCRRLAGVDLSPRSLALARQRCALYGVNAALTVGNAEQLGFADRTFDHVNCQGVVHHTPEPARAVAEIARVLRPGGTVVLSVYYRNVLLRHWPLLRHLLRAVPLGLRGRGRGDLNKFGDANEIVRYYDGRDNPIGIAFDRQEFENLLEPLVVEEVFFHFFPARALPVRVPRSLHRGLDAVMPFMIYARARR